VTPVPSSLSQSTGLAEVVQQVQDRLEVTYVGQDKRMDEWVDVRATRLCSPQEHPYQPPGATVHSQPHAESSSMVAAASWTSEPSSAFPAEVEADTDEPMEGPNNGRKRKRSSGSMSGIDEDDGAPSRRPRSSSPTTRPPSAAPSDDHLLLPNGHSDDPGELEGGQGKAGGKGRTRARLSRDDMNLAAAYTASNAPGAQTEEVMMTEEEYDLEQHKKITRQRNFDYVFFDHWKMKTW
jgi:hypothetical protein